jgi:hypothetical protein
MKIHFNATSISKAASTLLLSILMTVGATTPAIALASATQGSKASAFCSNIGATGDKATASISTLVSKLDKARTDQDNRILGRRATWDQDRASSQTKWDAQRQSNFAKVETKAVTPEQKAAVKAYETSITNALTIRRSANDAARASFRAGVDAAIKSRRSKLDDQVMAFSTTVASDIIVAKSSCSADSSAAGGPAIRVAFVDSLKSARTAFQNDRKDDDKITTVVKDLATTRENTVKANDSAFNAAAKNARDSLKAVFGHTAV